MGPKQYCNSFLFILFIAGMAHGQYREAEWDERDRWMDVSKLMDWAAVKEGSTVGDIGCHEGYLTIRMSKRVGNGKVYAIDVREDRLQSLQNHLDSRSLTNVEVVLGDYDDPKLPDAALDAIIVMDTYHEIEDYMAVLAHLFTALKPGGRVLILEKLKEHAKNKTRDEQMAAHTLSPKYVKRELEKIGFEIIKQIDDFGKWENEADKTMWVLVGEKPTE